MDAAADGASKSAVIASGFDEAHDVQWRRRPWEGWSVASAVRRIGRIIGKGCYDVVHVHTPVAAFVTRVAVRQMRSRPAVIYTAHGFHFHRGGGRLSNAMYRCGEMCAARWTDWLVTMNAEDYAAAQQFGTIDRERVRYIPGIGVDCSRYPPLDESEKCEVRRQLGLRTGQFAIVNVGEFVRNKRQELAVAALARVRRDVVGVFVGDGARRACVEAAAKRQGVTARFLGYRGDAGRVVAACDALVHVSGREGLPRAVLEALAAGVPVIGTDTRGTTDILAATGGGVVSGASPGLLAEAIECWAAFPEKARSIGTFARSVACEKFGLDIVLPQYQRLYEEAIQLGR